MSKFIERVQQEREQLKAKTFSLSNFLELMALYLNDPEFESYVMKVEKGQAVKIMTYPVQDFRKVLYKILLDYGVDASEAKTMLDSYQFKSKDLQGIYNFMTDFMYYYLKTGKSMKLFDKEDITASIFLKEQDEVVKESIDSEGNVKRVKQHKYNKLGQKSTCAKWNKSLLDVDGKEKRLMEKIVKNI